VDILHVVLVTLAAVVGGAVNALAGGGTLITFPMLTAIGIPAVAANITNTVALCPGYLGGTYAQLDDLRTYKREVWVLGVTGVVGGIAGGILLLYTGEKTFRFLVPYLILFATGLMAIQPLVRKWIARRSQTHGTGKWHEIGIVVAVALASVYGGFFGAGLSVIVLAVLALVLEGSLTSINALKQWVSFCVNIAAAIFFLFSGKIVWWAMAVMAVGAVVGGNLGGRLAGSIKPGMLRAIVIVMGLVIAAIYFVY
jgi:uncharacterized membrane protein YfcA